jgi:L-fucose dehydrogenase
MDLQLAGKVVIVTGGGSGIGAAISLSLAAEGAVPVILGRDPLTADFERELRALQPKALFIRLELTDEAACRAAVAQAVDSFGAIDGLVNNAGVNDKVGLEAGREAFVASLERNLVQCYVMAHLALPQLRASRGAIVNVASNWGLHGGPNAVAYCASKGGLVLLTKSLAVDHAAEGIRINAVCPGDVVTPMLFRDAEARGLGREAVLRESAATTRSGRATTPEEVAALVAWLASDEAAQVNGTTVLMDGGSAAG